MVAAGSMSCSLAFLISMVSELSNAPLDTIRTVVTPQKITDSDLPTTTTTLVNNSSNTLTYALHPFNTRDTSIHLFMAKWVVCYYTLRPTPYALRPAQQMITFHRNSSVDGNRNINAREVRANPFQFVKTP